jgi:hypothetical protein
MYGVLNNLPVRVIMFNLLKPACYVMKQQI